MSRHITRRFWLSHACVPALALCVVIALAAFSNVDLQWARKFFFDAATQHWRGAGTWWAENLLHTGGRNFVRALAVLALLLLICSGRIARLRRWRRPLAYFLTAMLMSTLLVGALKQITNVDCPWDLQGFGGTRPIVHLFADRPDALPHAACFPAAHSSSGFALMCCYFLLLHRSRGAALGGLALGLSVGAVFGYAQQARGAHFLTHDLTSALMVWLICLAVYMWGFGGDVAPTPAAQRTGGAGAA